MPKLRIGYLPFYVDYYEGICAGFAQEKTAIARRCSEMLAQYGEVVWNGKLIGDAQTANIAGEELATQNIDCIVVITTIAVFSGISWAALKHLNVPILIWNAQQIETVGVNYSMEEIVRNTGQIGSQALSNVLVREGRQFRVVTGYEADSRTSEQLRAFFRRIEVVSAVKNARLLEVGSTFPMMTDVELDARYLCEHIGASIVRVSELELTKAYKSTEAACVQARVDDAKAKYQISELTDDELSRSVRISEALNTFVDKHGVNAGTLNCHGANCLRNPEIGVTACYSLGVQNSLGRPFTCTGDLLTSLAMLMLKKLTGVSMYTEVQVMDLKRNAVVIANSGEGEPSIKHDDSALNVCGNTNFCGLHGRGASFAYPLKNGPATVVSLTPTPRGKYPFRLIVAEGEILDEPLPDAGALAGFFRFAHTDLHSGYTRWMEVGAVHHAGTTTGHWACELKEIAQMLNIEFVAI